jgi:hypothetical protein
MIGGAILPSVLHQGPRYFYQGTGTKKSRALHALSTPFICKGDNGRWRPNYSGLGGYLASGAPSPTPTIRHRIAARGRYFQPHL